jgi:hypothetical protein
MISRLRASGALEHAGLGARAHQALDLGLGDGLLHLLAHAEEAQDPLRGDREQLHERVHQPRQQMHRQRDPGRDCLRRVQREPLRHQLAEDQRAVGDADHDDCERDLLRVRADERQVRERGGELRHKRGLAERAAGNPDQRDPDLDRRQESPRVLDQAERRRCAGMAVLGEVLQPAAPAGDDGGLRHREDAVGEEEREQDEEFHRRGRAPGRAAKVGAAPE